MGEPGMPHGKARPRKTKNKDLTQIGPDQVDVTRFAPSMCGTCGYLTDAVGTINGSPGTPDEGDVTICLNCGAASEMCKGKWTSMTPERFALLSDEFRQEITQYQTRRAALIQVDLSTGTGGKA